MENSLLLYRVQFDAKFQFKPNSKCGNSLSKWHVHCFLFCVETFDNETFSYVVYAFFPTRWILYESTHAKCITPSAVEQNKKPLQVIKYAVVSSLHFKTRSDRTVVYFLLQYVSTQKYYHKVDECFVFLFLFVTVSITCQSVFFSNFFLD